MIIAKFKRSTNSKNFIPEIDGLRFFAIFTVILYHINTAYTDTLGIGLKEISNPKVAFSFTWWIVRMDLGVKVFFSISGFILALPFVNHVLNRTRKVDIKDYFYRRLTRLEPPFIVSFILFYFVHIFYLNGSASALLPNLGYGLIYSHCIVFGEPSPINPVSWSLETEAQYYMLVPILFAFLLTRGGLKTILVKTTGLIILGILGKSLIWEYQASHLMYSILYYLVNFLTGFLFALLYASHTSWMKSKSYTYDFMGLFSVLLIFFFYKPQALWYHNLLLNIGVFGMFLSAFKGTLTNYFYTRPFIYVIGGMCYTIYLLHYAFFHLSVKYLGTISMGYGYVADFWLQVLLNVPLMLLVASIFFLLIEKPCMDKTWPQKLKNALFKSN